MTKFKWVLAGFMAVALASQAAAQHIEISSGGHTKAAVDQSVTYRGKCSGTTYELQFNREERKLIFKPDVGATNLIDLTNSQFGKTFLNSPLYGKFGLGCNPEGLNVVFMGYELVPKASPRPVSYYAVINSAGVFVIDSGLHDEQPEVLEAQPRAQ